MAENHIRTRGIPKSAKPGGMGTPNMSVPLFGIVKDNIDPNRSGRIKVLLGDHPPLNSDTSKNWITVSYLSNFFGRVNASGGLDGTGSYKANPSSYGEWHAPPDIGTTVICIFINGDPNLGYYIGCVPEAESLHMVPAIGSSDYVVPNAGEAAGFGGATRLPATNINTNNSATVNSNEFNQAPRPVHSYSAAIMNQQGIIRDPIRGPISSSASREAISRVGWGVSTPGRPIYQGGYDDSTVANNLTQKNNDKLQVVARRGGHSIVMDDGDVIGRDQLIRIRTALGHQITMSDDGQTLMILHSNGQSYIELGKEGTVDIYSTNSFNVRTQGDLNLHADQNVNIHAAGSFNVQAKSIQTNSETTTQIRSTKDINIATLGALTGLSGKAIAWNAAGDVSMAGGGQAYVNGSKVNLNSGLSSTKAASVPTIPLLAQTDTLGDKNKGYMAAPAKLLTICSRAPAHAPWANAGQGVSVKTNLDADANLPPAPTRAVTAATAAGTEAASAPPAAATIASSPNIPGVSPSMGVNTAAAAIAAAATGAATGALSSAVSQGAAVVKTAQGSVAAVGAFALTPSQLVTGGVLKPGSDTLVTGLVNRGNDIQLSMPPSLFVGAPGAANLTELVQNPAAQAQSVNTSMQKSQTALTRIGAITGKETAAVVTGLVHAATSVGINATVGAIQQSAGVVLSNIASNTINNAANGIVAGINGGLAATSASGLVNSSLNNAAGSLAGAAGGAINNAVHGVAGAITGAQNQIQSALGAIGAGSAAASFASSLTGGLGGVATALTGMAKVPGLSTLVDQSVGVAASAFKAISASFKPLKAGVPQNLTSIAKTNAANNATVANQNSQAGSALAGITNSITSAATGAATGAIKAATAIAASSLATNTLGITAGLTALNAVNSIVHSASVAGGAVNNSTAAVTGAVTATQTAATNVASAIGGTATLSTAGGITGPVTSISNEVVGHALNTTIGGVENAINNVAAVSGAGPTIAAGGLPALSNAAAVVQQGAIGATSATLASGLSNLAGGINTAASVVNNAPTARNNIPGTSALTSLINNAQAAAMNGVSSAAGALGGLTSKANALNSIAATAVIGALPQVAAASAAAGIASAAASKLGGLASLAASGLSVGGAAQLQSAISALSKGGIAAIKMPTVGFNTNNRAAITAQTTKILGDPGIPAPNLTGEVSASTANDYQTKVDQAADLQKQYSALQKATNDAISTATDAQNKYITAKNNLPAGDPGITSAEDTLHNAVVALRAAQAAEVAFLKAHPEVG